MEIFLSILMLLLSVLVTAVPAAIDDHHVSDQERKLDVYRVPTKSPTTPPPSPAPRPSPAPITSAPITSAPSTSPAPSLPQATECSAIDAVTPGAFCYDGRGYKGGKGYTTCYTMESDEFCGTTVFEIDGLPDWNRCGDAWKWFNACVDSYGCEKVQNGAKFNYGKTDSRVGYKKAKKAVPEYWEFRMWGNGGGIDGVFYWKCPTKDAADGMKHFHDAAKGGNVMEIHEYCESDSPTVSLVPTSSPAPSEQPAPSCARPYTAPKSTPFYRQRGVPTPPKGRNNFEVQKNCNYRVSGSHAGGTKNFETPEEWIEFSAPLFNGQLNDNGATLTGGIPALSDFVVDGTVAKIKEGNGISGGDKTWQFGTNTESSAFVELFRNITRDAPLVWETNPAQDMKCGTTPDFCYDSKSYTSCYVDPVSENCGQYDYVIDGDTDYVRDAKIEPWFKACVESYGCDIRNSHKKLRSTGYRKVRHNEKSGRWDFRVNGPYWSCETEEQAWAMKDFADAVDAAELFEVPDGECTSSPTMSPTMCSDGFLTRAPLNIAVVIDISYSTYLTKFDGTAVGDLNKDGKRNTILDAEIAAVLALLDEIARSDILDNSNTDIGIILFDTEAYYKTPTYAPKGIYAPLQLNPDGTREPNPELVADLKSLQTLLTDEEVLVNNKGFTNFDDALDKAIDFFKDPALTLEGRTNLMVFLSDGKPNVRGDGDGEDWCPTEGGFDCVNLAPAGEDESLWDSAKPWENGKMTFCQAYDTTCDKSLEEFCARGKACEDADVTKSFDSELAELDKLGVTRISIGVGSHSDNKKGSGLDLIDNNPNKEFFTDLLPRQVLTSDDLTQLLRNLCLENTPNPTNFPSSQPTALPTPVRTDYPTKSPFSSPTASPTNKPTETSGFGGGGFSGSHPGYTPLSTGSHPGYTPLSTPSTKTVGVTQTSGGNPIVVGEQNCLDIDFGMTNQYGTTVDYMFVQYSDPHTGSPICEAYKNVSTDWFAEFSAGCTRRSQLSIVTITVVDSSFLVNDAASLPSCCGDDEILGEIAGTADTTKTAMYTYALDCCLEST